MLGVGHSRNTQRRGNCARSPLQDGMRTLRKGREDASSQEMQGWARESSCVLVDGAGMATAARHAPVSEEEATALVLQVPTSKEKRGPKEREGAASEIVHLVAAITLHWKGHQAHSPSWLL